MRLIDANFLKGIIQEEINKSDYQLFKDVMRVVCDMLDDSPTVDTVPVVRCKDCKHCSHGNCWVWGFMDTDPDNFCSYGERIGGE